MSATALPTPSRSRSGVRQESVHEWHLLAAQAARQLDPCVKLPEPLPHAELEFPDRPLGRAATRRLMGFRRRLVGLR
jgi:hypothetical protein